MTKAHKHVWRHAAEKKRPGRTRRETMRGTTPAAQEYLVKINHKIPMAFPRRVLDEAAACPQEIRPEDKLGRRDLTELPFATIDDETAHDFDDAIFVQKTRQAFCLHVAIADVTHYVKPGNAMDREAQERGNSCYFPRSAAPMLPPALSGALCSLQPGCERLAMVVEMDIDGQGATASTRIYAAVIRSAARLTYRQVQDFLDGRESGRQKAPDSVQKSLLAAAELAAGLLARRVERGGLNFDLPEPVYAFTRSGGIRAIARRESLFSRKIIEACMIAANEAVASFLEERGLPALYRTHPPPETERLTALFRSLRVLHLPLPLPQPRAAGDISTLLRAARNTPQEFLLGRLCLRAMMQARYHPENTGHFGLASASYCHATSPIRRYADIVVHRALKYALGLSSGPLFAGGRLIALADRLNRRERAALECEREMTRRMAVLFLADRVGENFEGIISSVNDFGFFMEFADFPVEGLARLMDIADDFYIFDPNSQSLLGRRAGRRFSLGQTMRATLAEVDGVRLEIRLIPEDLAGFSPASRRRKVGKRRAGRGSGAA